MFKILVVEDNPELNRSVCTFLRREGYDAVGCLSADEAYDKMYENVFDMLISDIMMPGKDGFELAEDVRAINSEIPILFMSARDDLAAKRMGFRIGIDDYMVKPISFDELLMRTEALLRRAGISAARRIVIGSLVMDASERSVTVGGDEIPLTAREFNILYKLLSYPKKTFSRTQLMDEFWDADTESGPRTVDVYMTKLRQKFSGCADFEIQTVHGLGYKAVIK